jgi:hypothetical protein
MELLIKLILDQIEMEHHIRYFDVLSSITAERLYVLDILRKQLCYARPDDLFLCGFSVEDALKPGYDFYSKIIYPDDLPLWEDIRTAVLRYLKKIIQKNGMNLITFPVHSVCFVNILLFPDLCHK